MKKPVHSDPPSVRSIIKEEQHDHDDMDDTFKLGLPLGLILDEEAIKAAKKKKQLEF